MTYLTGLLLVLFIYFSLYALAWNYNFFVGVFILYNILCFVVWVVLEVKSYTPINRGYLCLKILYTGYIAFSVLAWIIPSYRPAFILINIINTIFLIFAYWEKLKNYWEKLKNYWEDLNNPK